MLLIWSRAKHFHCYSQLILITLKMERKKRERKKRKRKNEKRLVRISSPHFFVYYIIWISLDNLYGGEKVANETENISNTIRGTISSQNEILCLSFLWKIPKVRQNSVSIRNWDFSCLICDYFSYVCVVDLKHVEFIVSIVETIFSNILCTNHNYMEICVNTKKNKIKYVNTK